MTRAPDRESFLRIVANEHAHMLDVHRELLDRLELSSNRALGIRIDFHGASAKSPTYHVYLDSPSAANEGPYTHALRVHTFGMIYVVWKGNIPGRLGEELRSAFVDLVKHPQNLDGSQIDLGDADAPFEVERCLRRAARAAKTFQR
jgi:hypothetical protein